MEAKMNILEYIEYLQNEYGMSEADAEREADAAFNNNFEE